jgi:hypothetical protein
MDGVHQRVDGRHAFFFRGICEMGIAGGCFRAGMAEKSLDVTKA